MEDGMKKTLFVLAALLAATAATAQTKNPVSTALRDILPGRQKNIVAAAEEMPADKFSYKPTADQMTFGHLMTHIIEANNLLCNKATGATAPKAEEVKDTDAKDKLVTALKASFDFCADALGKMDDSKLGDMTEGFEKGKQVTRAWASIVLASSWADHYGTEAMYLRLNGLTPPTAHKKEPEKKDAGKKE
jgi:uncharacterized damage-inducible protein DinB